LLLRGSFGPSSSAAAAAGAAEDAKGAAGAASESAAAGAMAGPGSIGKPVLMVCVVGGISFLEIAALRHLSRDPAFPFSIVVASTNIINGNSFLASLMHQMS
jgi:hypothetical protein